MSPYSRRVAFFLAKRSLFHRHGEPPAGGEAIASRGDCSPALHRTAFLGTARHTAPASWRGGQVRRSAVQVSSASLCGDYGTASSQ